MMTELLAKLRKGESVMFHRRLVVDTVLLSLLIGLLVIFEQGSDVGRIEHRFRHGRCFGRMGTSLAVIPMSDPQIDSLKTVKLDLIGLFRVGSKGIKLDFDLHAAKFGIDSVETLIDRYIGVSWINSANLPLEKVRLDFGNRDEADEALLGEVTTVRRLVGRTVNLAVISGLKPSFEGLIEL